MSKNIISLQDIQRKAAADQAHRDALTEIGPLYRAMAEMDAAELSTFCKAMGEATEHIIKARKYDYFTDPGRLAALITTFYIESRIKDATSAGRRA
jgi:hypothetical protein